MKKKVSAKQRSPASKSKHEIAEINRTVCIVSMKKPFAEWLNSLPDRGETDWTEAVLTTQHVILLPDDTLDDEEMTNEILSRYWARISLFVFGEWVFEPDWWPKNFSVEQFQEWFQLEFIDSPVVDLTMEPLERIG